MAGAASGPSPYSESYEEARTRFRQEWPQAEHGSFPVPNNQGEDNTVDYIYFPGAPHSKLLIITSGVHGIEGFTGSALQWNFLEHLKEMKRPDLSLLIVHALNPYGFRHERRVTENNVDLNRNLDVRRDLFKIKNPSYSLVRDFLNPQVPAHFGPADRLNFYFHAGINLYKYSMQTLRRSVLSGQYEHPQDLYFGGRDFEPQKESFEKLVLEKAQDAPAVFLIDLHTGYGQRGTMHLYGDSDIEINKNILGQFFPMKSIDFGEDKDFYRVTGGMVLYVGRLMQKEKKQYAGITFEFGTLNSQTTLGSLDSIYRMSRENQLVQFGSKDTSTADAIKKSFHEMFYPSDPKWRDQVLSKGQEALSKVYKNF